MRFKLVLPILLIIVLVSALTSRPVNAAGNAAASSITVKPFLQQITLNPGDGSKQFDLTISNDSKFKQVFHLSVINFGTLNETGGLTFEGSKVSSLTNKYGLAHWLQLEASDVTLDAGQQRAVKVTIQNDSGLSPGAHYAAIITSAYKLVSKVGQLTITPKVSSLIFANKVGGEIYDIHLQSISHNGNILRPPNEINVRLKSTGNTYITPRGIVYLKQGSKTIYKGIINSQSALVLPGAIRNFYVPLIKLDNPKNGLIFTRYAIQVDYRYDGNSNFASQSLGYRVIKTSGLVMLILAGVIGALILKKRESIRKDFSRYKKHLSKK